MITVTTRDALQCELEAARADRRRLGLVPTMGYLHEGHLSLVDRASAASDFIIMSIFVNPLQFGPGEDLSRYPRDLARDSVLAEERGVDLLFVPSVDEMYASPPAVVVDAPGLTDRLCGRFRPGHFLGVLTIVAKLFHLVQPDVAVFGQKDFQQLTLIRLMVRDLDLPIQVLAGAIVRESDGLALSSRNVYLSEPERRDAVLLNAGLQSAQRAFSAGQRDAVTLVAAVREKVGSPHIAPQYIELVAPDTLDAVPVARPGDVLALAAHVGATRLIDNHVLTDALP